MSVLSGLDIALWDLKGNLTSLISLLLFSLLLNKKSYILQLSTDKCLVTGRNLGVPVYELLGGKVRDEVQVYAWIGGDRRSDVETAA